MKYPGPWPLHPGFEWLLNAIKVTEAMSGAVLGKEHQVNHPGPWKLEHSDVIKDTNDAPVLQVTLSDALLFADDEAQRLILAAPEMLAMLERVLENGLDDGGYQEDKATDLLRKEIRALIDLVKEGTAPSGPDPVARPQPQPAVPGPSRLGLAPSCGHPR